MSKYFSFDPDDGFSFHKTEEEAKKRCLEAFEYFETEAAGDGWPENVSEVCWGEIRGRATLIESIDRPPKDQLDEENMDRFGNDWSQGDWDEIQKWEIKPIT